MSERHDVVVVGGGPAGSVAAAALARAGRRVVLLEMLRHMEVRGRFPVVSVIGEDRDLQRAAPLVEQLQAELFDPCQAVTSPTRLMRAE